MPKKHGKTLDFASIYEWATLKLLKYVGGNVMNVFVGCLAFLLGCINIVAILKSRQNLKAIGEALKRQRETFEILSQHFETLETDEERIVFVRSFFKAMAAIKHNR